MTDLTGKHIIVTGATNGIGEITAIELAKMGASVTIISRSAEKLENTASKIRAAGGEADIIQADLSSVEEIHAAANAYKARHNRLDVLLNNAGAVFNERRESVDGIEMTVALNHISYFVLTQDLLPLLQQTAEQQGEARVVNVSSDAHRSGMNWDDLQFQNGYNGFNAYGQSKAMNILFTKELARRLEGTNVTANAVHPGFVDTGFGENNSGFITAVFKLAKKFFAKSPEEGAETSIYVASSPQVQSVSGKYFADKQQKDPILAMNDETNWTRLWNITEQWLEKKQPATTQ